MYIYIYTYYIYIYTSCFDRFPRSPLHTTLHTPPHSVAFRSKATLCCALTRRGSRSRAKRFMASPGDVTGRGLEMRLSTVLVVRDSRRDSSRGLWRRREREAARRSVLFLEPTCWVCRKEIHNTWSIRILIIPGEVNFPSDLVNFSDLVGKPTIL